jgi:hypothetical protein
MGQVRRGEGELVDGAAKWRETAAMEAATINQQEPAEPRWKQQLTGGSRKGIPNRQTVAIKEAIEKAFSKLGGVDYLVKVGQKDPRTFCALLSRLLPTKLANADGSPLLAALTELTDAQLEARTQRALADAQRLGIAAQPVQAIEVQAEVVTEAKSL